MELPARSNHSEAQELLKKGKWPEAAIVLRTVVKNEPGNLSAIVDLARALTFTGRREEALSLLAGAVETERRANKETLIRRARVLSRLFLTNLSFQLHQDGLNLMVSRKYDEAREKLDQALALEPDNVEVLVRSAQCFVLDGDYDSAVERLRLSRRLNPYETEIRLWLGHAMLQRGESKLALEELKAAHEQLKKDETATLWYAEALAFTGQRAHAVRLLEEDAMANPKHLNSLLALAKLRMLAQTAVATQPMPMPSPQGLVRDRKTLWTARQELQLLLSRATQGENSEPIRLNDTLGVQFRPQFEDLRVQAKKLLELVEDRLERLSNSSAEATS
jgi:thioredoxin-like negative regulator of GroEL